MIYFNFHFMGNILFNFLPGPKAIAERGYAPLLSLLEKFPAIRGHIYSSSRTGLIIKRDFPEVYRMIRKGMADGRIRIGFNGYEHAAFNCLSADSVMRQIQKGLATDQEIWEVKPRGYWPSDCRWDPYVGYALRDQDMGWVFLHREDFKVSCPGGKFHPDWKDLDLYRPLNLKCPLHTRLPAMLYSNPNYDLFKPDETEQWFAEFAALHTERRSDAYVSIGLDFETLLVLEVKGAVKEPARAVEVFFSRLVSLPYVRHTFADEVLRSMPPEQEAFARPSYWAHFGGAYPDGVQKILALCDAAERDLLMGEDLLALVGERPDTAGLKREMEQAWDHLLIGENSEVRFTDPSSDAGAHTFYPTESLILETYDHAIRAHEMARNIKQRLIGIYRDNKRQPI